MLRESSTDGEDDNGGAFHYMRIAVRDSEEERLVDRFPKVCETMLPPRLPMMAPPRLDTHTNASRAQRLLSSWPDMQVYWRLLGRRWGGARALRSGTVTERDGGGGVDDCEQRRELAGGLHRDQGGQTGLQAKCRLSGPTERVRVVPVLRCCRGLRLREAG